MSSHLVTGTGDVTYNSRRGILGAISVGGKISYHLYSLATSKAGDIVKLIRKSRWHSQYHAKERNKFLTTADSFIEFASRLSRRL